MVRKSVYTIGHSTHSKEYFLELLKAFDVNVLVDVRSQPASRFNPQFNKKAISDFLEANDIRYLHFGEAFGARKSDPALFTAEGQVDFEKVRRSEAFLNGMEWLEKGAAAGYRMALMCSEADPLQCHRFGMISPSLKESGWEVLHILKDKTVKNQTELESELLALFAKRLAAAGEEALLQAYLLLNKKIGFKQ